MISGSTTESSLARDSILEVCNLVVEFSSADGTIVAVDRLSLTVPRNRAVALIGESGCGKSSTVFAVPRLLPASGRIVGGSITYAHDPGGPGIDLTTLPEKELESVRGRQIGMIMQGSQCLNPAYSVGQEIVRVLITDGENRQSAWTRARKLLEEVGIGDAERCMLQHHHELSGGLQQRVVLAMARARKPALLIADEPTSALDVSARAEIIDLFREVMKHEGLSILMATHDLAAAAALSEYVYVMYAGQIVEHGAVESVLCNPVHPYTQALIRALPKIDQPTWQFQSIPGVVPDPIAFPSGCRFHPRCPFSARLAADGTGPKSTIEMDGRSVDILASCRGDPTSAYSSPTLTPIRANHFVACWERDNA